MRVNPSLNNVRGTTADRTEGPDKSSKSAKSEKSGRASSSSAAEQTRFDNGDVKTELSARGKEFAQAKALAAQTPDVREDKIAELKKRIAAGQYNVSPQAIADKLVDEHLEQM